MCSCSVKGIGRKKSKPMSKKKTRRRPRVSGLNSRDMQGFATSAALGGVGSVVLKMVLDKVLPAEYTQYTSYAQIIAGVTIAAMSKNTMVQAAGLGAATVGAANVVQDLTDGQVSGMGLLPYGKPSALITGYNESEVKAQ